jgi:hypothetical protein
VADLSANHAPDIAAMDLFVVPTIGFRMLYGFVIVRLDRRDLVWINVTTNPTREWIARQITEAFPWDGAPRYTIRDRDHFGSPSSNFKSRWCAYTKIMWGELSARDFRSRPEDISIGDLRSSRHLAGNWSRGV